jgi:type IV secretory pathway VirB4 component
MCVNNHAADLEWVTENPDRASSIPPHFTLMQVLEKLEPAADLKNFRGSLDAVDQLRKWLVPFTKTGQFGFLFSEHEKPREYDSHRFMVYDLGGISDKRLQSMAAQLVSLKLIRDIKKLSRATQKLIIFEELGVFLHGESETTKDIANRLVKNITKTVRKYNGIPHGITNGVEDFFDHPGGLSFWSQATRRIFLPMTPAMIEKLRAKAEDLDSADIDILQSLHIKDGAYTQAYIIIGQGRDKIKVVIDIPLSPTAGAVFMTSGSVCAYYDKLRSEGMKVVDALEKLSAHLERTMQ